MDKSKLPIGIFDSGVGGLTVVNKLRMLLPHENIIYVGIPNAIRTDREPLRKFCPIQGIFYVLCRHSP